ncbi:hypothetical protein L227DRAFT_438961 [Lentinus tigrinus ALCF2SS1-6]|uniref:Uncharacterized protein n=1 Tax=Lentinus tigrinus ALCF2SS1-6 TaxID=1328759 RepID=A0A5C2SHZ1_9APHY|nr:hypothetical protein L227DRAFT_438961 [Lentinus tigrinus ALCF2SS1-6]
MVHAHKVAVNLDSEERYLSGTLSAAPVGSFCALITSRRKALLALDRCPGRSNTRRRDDLSILRCTPTWYGWRLRASLLSFTSYEACVMWSIGWMPLIQSEYRPSPRQSMPYPSPCAIYDLAMRQPASSHAEATPYRPTCADVPRTLRAEVSPSVTAARDATGNSSIAGHVTACRVCSVALRRTRRARTDASSDKAAECCVIFCAREICACKAPRSTSS